MSDINQSFPARDKTWPERDVDAKLDALREQVIYLLHRVGEQNVTIHKLLDHCHGLNGELLVKMNDNRHDMPTSHRTPMALRDKE